MSLSGDLYVKTIERDKDLVRRGSSVSLHSPVITCTPIQRVNPLLLYKFGHTLPHSQREAEGKSHISSLNPIHVEQMSN